MSAAVKGLGALIALGIAGCSTEEQPAALNNAAESADIEALPADESAATPSDQLANGAAEPQGNTVDVEP